MLSQLTEAEPTFFEKERERLTDEITAGFEELLSTSNTLNRKLEEVLGMTKEYETISSLWSTFQQLARGHRGTELWEEEHTQPPGLPGTGGHVVGE